MGYLMRISDGGLYVGLRLGIGHVMECSTYSFEGSFGSCSCRTLVGLVVDMCRTLCVGVGASLASSCTLGLLMNELTKA